MVVGTRRIRAQQDTQVRICAEAVSEGEGGPVRGVPGARAKLVREGGLCALLTMRGWMFLGQLPSYAST